MNNEEIRERLARIAELTGGMVSHESFVLELNKLLKGSLRGKEKQFFTLFELQLRYLIEYGVGIGNIDANEWLKNTGGPYYSLHLQRKEFNIRMLVRIDQKHTYLLCIFYEREGKNATDYTSHVPEMEKRYEEIKED